MSEERCGTPASRLVWLLATGLAATSCTGSIDNVGGAPACEDCAPGQAGSSTGSSSHGALGDSPAAPGDATQPAGIGDPESPDGVGYATRVPKLSNAQWERSVQDLLRLDGPTGLASNFTQEASDKGYDTAAAATLTISGDAWARYQTAAETLAEQVTSDAQKLAKITPSGSFADDTARAKAFIAEFGRRAYRRPLTDAEQDAYLALYQEGPELATGPSFNAGVRLVLEGMLQSPNFLYRVEAATNAGDPANPRAWLSGYEIATRLSYALWGTTPSDALLEAAESGALDTQAGVATWAAKLLDDPRARAVLLSFHEQTFAIDAYGTQDKDPSLGFDAAQLEPVLQDEARSFLGVILDEDGGIAQLLTSPVAFVNRDTAPFYGLTGVTSGELERHTLDASERAGLFTQLGFLSKNATRSGSDPVHRGLAVLRKLLCDEPDPPPMMFQLPMPEPGLTTREVYEQATACGVGCHDTLINPPGFAFEGFDAVGKLRATEQGKAIDATGTLTLRDGFTPEAKRANPTTELSFDGAVDMMAQLSTAPRVHECYARNVMKFVLAREVAPVERGASRTLGESSEESGSVRELLLSLVKLDTFRARVSDPE